MLGVSVGHVYGNSMLPTVVANSFIISFKYPRWYPKHLGQIFYIQHPNYGPIIKKLKFIDGDDYWFAGESSDSISSTDIGAIKEEQIIGRVIWIISPPQTNKLK